MSTFHSLRHLLISCDDGGGGFDSLQGIHAECLVFSEDFANSFEDGRVRRILCGENDGFIGGGTGLGKGEQFDAEIEADACSLHCGGYSPWPGFTREHFFSVGSLNLSAAITRSGQ